MANSIWVLGMMSGTSLDGVDAALVKTDGQGIEEIGDTAFRAYSDSERDILSAALGRWPENGRCDAASEVILNTHIDIAQQFPKAQLIGFHGQTLNHDPKTGRSFQLGDAQALARALDRDVIADMRQNDLKNGGEGAPLAPFYHFAIAKKAKQKQPLAILNLGGVGNITYIDPSFADPSEIGALLAFDTGPANAPMNDVMAARLGIPYDRDGALGAEGTPDLDIVQEFMSHSYFTKRPPKSLDRDDFAWLIDRTKNHQTRGALASLGFCAARAIKAGFDWFPKPVSACYVTGGGRMNAFLMSLLRSELPCHVDPIEALGANGDMLEAEAFAYLAARSKYNLPLSAPSTTGCKAPSTGGVLYQP